MPRLVLAVLALPVLLPGAVLVTNFPLNSQAGAGYNIGANSSAALVVSIGASDIRFDRLETGLNVFCSPTCPFTVEGGIFADGGNAPGALLAAFISQDLNDLMEAQVDFVTAAPFTLAANTTYWLVLSAPAVPTVTDVEWIDGGEPYTDSAFATSPGFSVSNSGGPWTPVGENPVPGSDGNPQAQVIGTVIPEPGTVGLIGAGLLLLTLRIRRTRRTS
jgi:hypothetical protein